jgi:predicted anti-sigma-YlaC factor YlaD
MECLDEEKIHEYIDGSLTTVERSIARDHLIVCSRCRDRYEAYEKIEKSLSEPVYYAPPPIIERNVLNLLFPRIPSYSSIAALIAASFLLLVSSIYVYFDFANNSIVQALQMTSHNTSNWLGSIIRAVSTIFSAVYAVFKAVNKLIEIVFSVNVGVEVVGLSVLLVLLLGFYTLSHLMFKKIKGSN